MVYHIGFGINAEYAKYAGVLMTNNCLNTYRAGDLFSYCL